MQFRLLRSAAAFKPRKPNVAARLRAVLDRRALARIAAQGPVAPPAAGPAPSRPKPRGPLHYHAGLLPRRSDRTVAVLADETLRIPVLRQYLQGLTGDRVTILGGPADVKDTLVMRAPALHFVGGDDVDWLVRNGPVDIMINLRHPKAKGRRTRWTELFLFLASARRAPG